MNILKITYKCLFLGLMIIVEPLWELTHSHKNTDKMILASVENAAKNSQKNNII